MEERADVHHLGVLAFGSLIRRPGRELDEVIGRRIAGVVTPFHVEFARSSGQRGGAPTLVPVSQGGSHVTASVLVAKDDVSLEEVRNLLYRREIDQERSSKVYVHRDEPGPNHVQLPALSKVAGIDVVIYTSIMDTIPQSLRTGEHLAQLAIESVGEAAAGRDGISYLMDALKQGIATALSGDYEAAILRATEADTLVEALESVRGTQRDP